METYQIVEGAGGRFNCQWLIVKWGVGFCVFGSEKGDVEERPLWFSFSFCFSYIAGDENGRYGSRLVFAFYA